MPQFQCYLPEVTILGSGKTYLDFLKSCRDTIAENHYDNSFNSLEEQIFEEMKRVNRIEEYIHPDNFILPDLQY